MAFCQVRYRDIEGIQHQVEVQADSLFEAVALAAREFREGLWCGHPPGPGSEFTVRVMKETPQSYSIPLARVEEFAEHGTAVGPSNILRKKKLRELLGIHDERAI